MVITILVKGHKVGFTGGYRDQYFATGQKGRLTHCLHKIVSGRQLLFNSKQQLADVI